MFHTVNLYNDRLLTVSNLSLTPISKSNSVVNQGNLLFLCVNLIYVVSTRYQPMVPGGPSDGVRDLRPICLPDSFDKKNSKNGKFSQPFNYLSSANPQAKLICKCKTYHLTCTMATKPSLQCFKLKLYYNSVIKKCEFMDPDSVQFCI